MNGFWKSKLPVIMGNLYKGEKKSRKHHEKIWKYVFKQPPEIFCKTWKKFSGEETPLWVDMHGEDNDVLKDHSEHSAW